MAQQTINLGAAPDDGTGDTIRVGGDKINDNFDELYDETLKLKGSTDCSANPNYPAASKGDLYRVSVAGKIGGASGVDVEVGDSYFATADNAGGDHATVGTSWTVLQGNITSYLPLSGGTLTGDLIVPDEAYDATNWDGNLEVPTKNAVRDKIEALAGGTGIDVQDEGVAEATGATTLNFVGAGVVAADMGGGVVDVTIAGGGSGVDVEDEGVSEATGATTLNFAGAGVTATDMGGGVVDVVIPGGGSGTSYEAGPVTPPTTADLATWDNQGTSTATDGTGAMILKPQVDGLPHGRYKTAPATPYDVYCRVEQHWLSTAANTAGVVSSAGILFKDTGGDNERLGIGIYAERIAGDENMTYAIVCGRWSGAGPPVFSANPVVKYTAVPWQWVKVNNDGTTLTISASPDGKNFFQIGTETLAAYIDAAASFGVFAYASANATEAPALFSYFSTTAPA